MSLFGYKPKYKKALWKSLPTEKSKGNPLPLDYLDEAIAQLKKQRRQKAIRPVSKKRQKENKEYAKARAEHFAESPRCQKCDHEKNVELHHKRGRAGKMLTDKRYFITLCRMCHAWVHRYPCLAQEMGLIAAKGDWGKQDPQ